MGLEIVSASPNKTEDGSTGAVVHSRKLCLPHYFWRFLELLESIRFWLNYRVLYAL